MPFIILLFKAFCKVMDDIIVSPKDDIDFVREDIIKIRIFGKVKSIVAGGDERYDSVYNGLKEAIGDISSDT